MSKCFLTYFILVLVVFQSTAGIADAHQSHQSGTEHLTFDEGLHAHEGSAVDHNFVQGAEEQESDCHHCCHCHGHFNPAVFVKPAGFALRKSSVSISDYSENFPSEITTPLLRPPIALT